MVAKRHLMIISPILFIMFLFIIEVSWLMLVGWGLAITLASVIGYHVEVIKERETAKKELFTSIWNSLLWVGIAALFFFYGFDLSLWRRILIASCFLILAVFNFINSYVWYKKEQLELLQEENRNV